MESMKLKVQGNQEGKSSQVRTPERRHTGRKQSTVTELVSEPADGLQVTNGAHLKESKALIRLLGGCRRKAADPHPRDMGVIQKGQQTTAAHSCIKFQVPRCLG